MKGKLTISLMIILWILVFVMSSCKGILITTDESEGPDLINPKGDDVMIIPFLHKY